MTILSDYRKTDDAVCCRVKYFEVYARRIENFQRMASRMGFLLCQFNGRYSLIGNLMNVAALGFFLASLCAAAWTVVLWPGDQTPLYSAWWVALALTAVIIAFLCIGCAQLFSVEGLLLDEDGMRYECRVSGIPLRTQLIPLANVQFFRALEYPEMDEQTLYFVMVSTGEGRCICFRSAGLDMSENKETLQRLADDCNEVLGRLTGREVETDADAETE